MYSLLSEDKEDADLEESSNTISYSEGAAMLPKCTESFEQQEEADPTLLLLLWNICNAAANTLIVCSGRRK